MISFYLCHPHNHPVNYDCYPMHKYRNSEASIINPNTVCITNRIHMLFLNLMMLLEDRPYENMIAFKNENVNTDARPRTRTHTLIRKAK